MAVGIQSLNLLRDVVDSILSKSFLGEPSYVNQILIRIFVLAHHSNLPRHQWSWIDIATNANVDPGVLTTTHTEEFISAIEAKLWPVEKAVTVFTKI